MRKDGCCCVQLGKIMNEVDRGWRRPSLKRNGSQQRDGDIDPSVTFFSSFTSVLSFLTNINSHKCVHGTPRGTRNKQHGLIFATHTHIYVRMREVKPA